MTALPVLRARAFSLLELIVVIAIILTVILIALPITGQLRERSQGIGCVNNLRQIGVATMQFLGENRNELPYYWYPVGNDSGDGSSTGSWYYNLAPYLNMPRNEVNPNTASYERTYLGTPTKSIGAPCVFTCPGHKKTESPVYWDPPMSWPTRRPVSYAPSLEIRGDRTGRPPATHGSGANFYPVRFSDIKHPSQKIWISESPIPTVLNCDPSRWKGTSSTAWPRQAFSRHNKGGNVLFYDGHVRWIALSTFVEPRDGSIERVVNLYFNPYRDPETDR